MKTAATILFDYFVLGLTAPCRYKQNLTPPELKSPMKIAHLSDTHICLPEPENSHRLKDLTRAVDEINQAEPLPQLVVHTGDIAHNGQAREYQAAHKLLAQLKMPLYVIPGNKDERKEMRKVFGDEMRLGVDQQFFQYSINCDSYRLLFLDTLDEGERLGTFCKSRFSNFTHLLEEDRRKPTIVFMHHPTFDIVEAPRPFQFDSRETVRRFDNIVRNNPQITRIFSGHSHRYGRHAIGNTELLAISAVAIDLRWGDYGEEMRDRPVYEIYEL
jgi:Icc protein